MEIQTMNGSRRTHRKSRNGCLACKRRKVKCNEERPTCSNCAKRRVSCYYTAAPRLSSYSPELHSDRPAQRSDHHTCFGPFDLELMHHYSIEVAPTFASDGRNPQVWEQQIPKAAFSNGFVLHAVLAVAALHMCWKEPIRESECKQAAQKHYSLTLPLMINALDQAQTQSASPLFLAAVLLCFYNFAVGPRPGDFLIFSDEGPTEWTRLLQGVRTISEQHEPFPMHSWLDESTATTFNIEPNLIMPSELDLLIPGLGQAFDKLTDFITTLNRESADFAKYLVAIQRLRRSFILGIRGNADSRNTVRPTTQSAFAWLYQLEADYLSALQEKKPFALVVFAMFDVLLNQHQDIWYLKGWSKHIMIGIRQHLHTDYHHWLDWPSSVITTGTAE